MHRSNGSLGSSLFFENEKTRAKRKNLPLRDVPVRARHGSDLDLASCFMAFDCFVKKCEHEKRHVFSFLVLAAFLFVSFAMPLFFSSADQNTAPRCDACCPPAGLLSLLLSPPRSRSPRWRSPPPPPRRASTMEDLEPPCFFVCFSFSFLRFL